jgi:general secretion pathway protein G
MKKRQQQFGFTLVEILVVITIIGILMALTLGIAGAANRNAAKSKATAEMGALLQEIDLFKADTGSYPTPKSVNGTPTLPQAFYNWYEVKYGNGNGVEDAEDRIYKTTEVGLSGGEKYPVDPWGQPYVYLHNTSNPLIFFLGSKGPDTKWGDGTPNTSSNFGEGDDLTTKKGLTP